MAEDGHDGAIEITDEPGTVIGQMNESLQQSIAYAMQLFPKASDSPQRRGPSTSRYKALRLR